MTAGSAGQFEEKLKKAKTTKEVEHLLVSLNEHIQKTGMDPDMLHVRAKIFIKLQRFGPAINDYRTILSINKEDKTAQLQVEQLKTILKFTNTDIYANPNTNFDPWLD